MPPSIQMLPRERLTRKASRAIHTYVDLMCGERPAFGEVVGRTIAAERTRRATLYADLEARGLRWYPRHGEWAKNDQHARLGAALRR